VLLVGQTFTFTFTFVLEGTNMKSTAHPRFRNRPVGIITCGLVGLGGLAVSLAVASQRMQPGSRSAPVKKVINEAQVISESERPLTMGYKVGGNEVWVTVGSEATGFTGYRLETDPDSKSVKDVPLDQSSIKPESFVRMSGTREGMAAIAGALAQMLTDQSPAIRSIKAPTDPVAAKVEGVAFFEDEGVVHLLAVRIVGNKPEFEDIGGVAAGCSVSLPSTAGGCGCNASGAGSSCVGWTGTDNKYHVKCTDSAGTMNCSGGGGGCECAAAM